MTFQGKVEGKQLFSFGANKAAYDVLTQASPGEVYEIDVVKNDAGYNDWVKAVKSDGSISQPASTPSGPKAGNTYTASPKSTYETPEERAVKQIYIVRQSNIASAINLLSVGAKTTPPVEAVLAVAKQLEDHVFGSTKVPPMPDTTFADLDTLDDMPQ